MHSYDELRKFLRIDLPNADNPVVTSDMELSAVRASSLFRSFLKKNVDEISVDADSACLSLFLEANEHCRTFSVQPQELFMDMVYQEVVKTLDAIFHRGPDLRFSSFDFEKEGGVGPGASVGVTSEDFFSKLFGSTHTYTNGQLPVFYNRYVQLDAKWLSAENLRKSHFGGMVVRGSRLSFVPKTSAISRSICTEPLLNMFFQKGIGACLEEVLKSDFSIDLSTQPEVNRRLARSGSIDGSFGTIDLKSASDSISLKLVRDLFPKYIVNRLEACRSPCVCLPDGREVELHMISSMGNGFTFPLMTLLFTVVVKSVYRTLGIKFQRNVEHHNGTEPGNWGVFGDDIIVRKDAYDVVVKALRMFGFMVNDDKSFNNGYFRESCGGDYWKGHDVRGVYLKSLKHKTDVYSIINRLTRWSCISGIPLTMTLRYLRSLCRFNPVPLHAGDTEGIKVPRAYLKDQKHDRNGSVFYRAVEAVSLSFSVPSGDAERSKYPNGKAVFSNPDGALIAFVGGYITNGRIGLRNIGLRRFKVRTRKTPCWDFPSADLKGRVHDFQIMYGLLTNFGNDLSSAG